MSNVPPTPPPPDGAPTPPPPPASAVPPPPPSTVPQAPPAPPMMGAPAPGAPPMFQAPTTVTYAGWWRRVLAGIIDGVIYGLFLIPAIVALLAGPTEIDFREDGPEGPGFYEVPTGGTWAIFAILLLVGIVAYLVIYVRMLGKGATFGRKAAGYRILDQNTLQPIGTARAVGRYFATFLSAIPFYLGFLWPLWDAEKRTFHDMVVGTRAVAN